MKVTGRPTVELTITIQFTEEEARALDALFGYSADGFLQTFYEKMGKSYLEPHEQGFRSLHRTASGTIRQWLDRASKARKAFSE